LLLLSATAAAALSLSPVASAKPGYFIVPAERLSQLTVKGTHGFQITIARIGGRVELTASSGNVAAIYVVRPAKAPADRIEGNFPGLGKVSVRFHPAGRAQSTPAFCGGRASFRQNGIFSGTIRFEGEMGFTRIHVENARGSVFRSFKEVCKESGEGDDSETPPSYSLTEKARSQGKTTVFAATKSADILAPDRSATYFASQWKRQHGMVSVRVATAQADRDSFAIAGPPFRPESATITPPSPFSGAATFQASPGALAKWEGTLAVALPGVGSVPLTGSHFRPELCRGQRCVGRPENAAELKRIGPNN
jgi:hypothetical protein